MFAKAFAGRDFRDISIAEISAHLHASFKQLADLNPGMMKGLDANVWSDGGCFLPPPERIDPPPVTIERMDSQLYCRSIDDAVEKIRSKIDDNVVPSISLPCGLGKSTVLMTRLAQARIADHVISIQPTPTVAIQLSDYQIAKRENATYGIMKSPMSVSYVAASEFLNAVVAGDDFHNSLIVVDEEHMSTPVHHALLHDALPRVTGKIMKMTASRSATLPSRPDVVQHVIKQVDDNVVANLKFAQTPIVVGVDDRGKVHTPGSLLTGANVKVRNVVDTGRRLDPIVIANEVCHAERVASTLELTQSLGRINRFDRHKPGTFHYVASPCVSKPHRHQVNYYGVIYSALHTMFSRPDAQEAYVPILKGTSAKFIVPLPSRSATSGSSDKTTGKPSTPVIVTQPNTHVTISPSHSVRGWVSNTRPVRNDPFHVGVSTWWSQKPSAVVLASSGNRVMTLREELDSVLIDLNFTMPTQQVSSKDLRDANDILAGQRIPIFDDDEIHAIVVMARRWIDASIMPGQNKNLLDNLRNYFLSAKRARYDGG